MSAQVTHESRHVAGGPLLDSPGRLAPRAPKLVMLVVVAASVIGALVVLAADAGQRDIAPETAHSRYALWLVGLSLVSTAVGLVHRAARTRRIGSGLAPATGDAAVLAFENARLLAELHATASELQRSRARIASAAAAERHRLERELHDRAQNRLTALQIRLGLVRERAEGSAPEVATMLAELGDQAEAVGDELRRIARGIEPPLLATRGLTEALMAEARFAGVPVRIVADRVGSSTPEAELAVYLCCLEAIQNVAKHAGRDVQVTVRLSRGDDELAFSVHDDGCGLDSPSAAASGSGLSGMRERISGQGGWLKVSSVRGHGTTVTGAVPWPPRVPNTALCASLESAVACNE